MKKLKYSSRQTGLYVTMLQHQILQEMAESIFGGSKPAPKEIDDIMDEVLQKSLKDKPDRPNRL